jgi:hypothetical protein
MYVAPCKKCGGVPHVKCENTYYNQKRYTMFCQCGKSGDSSVTEKGALMSWNIIMTGATHMKLPNIDRLFVLQKKANAVESEICNIMEIPAGAKLLKWAHAVRSSWLYKIMLALDRRVRELD